MVFFLARRELVQFETESQIFSNFLTYTHLGAKKHIFLCTGGDSQNLRPDLKKSQIDLKPSQTHSPRCAKPYFSLHQTDSPSLRLDLSFFQTYLKPINLDTKRRIFHCTGKIFRV